MAKYNQFRKIPLTIWGQHHINHHLMLIKQHCLQSLHWAASHLGKSHYKQSVLAQQGPEAGTEPGTKLGMDTASEICRKHSQKRGETAEGHE